MSLVAYAARLALRLLPVMVGAQLQAQVQASVQAGAQARLVGIAFDSVAMRPLAGALVRAVPVRYPSSSLVVRADSAGRFTLGGLAPGRWLATALHPVFDSLEIEPPVAQIDVREGGDVELVLSTPSARDYLTHRCSTLDADLGVLFGSVRRAEDDAPSTAATVAVEWPEWTLRQRSRGLRGETITRVARADSLGRYVVCGVPVGNTVRVHAWSEGDSTGVLEVPNDPRGVTRRDLYLATAERLVRPGGDSAELGFGSQRLGRATVTGRVRDANGRPVAGAIVRVLGSGDASRTDSSGSFVVRRAMMGSQMVEARAIGFGAERQAVDLRGEAPSEVRFTLANRQVELDTVRVTADRAVSPALLAVEHRMRSGVGGTFLDGDAIRRQATRFVSDALVSVNGVRVRDVNGAGQRILMRRSDGRACLPQVFVDGVAVHTGIPVPRGDEGPTGDDIGEMFLDDFVRPGDVAAMEVYPRFASVPAPFQTLSGCGAVVVWTRQHFGGVSVRDPRRP